MQLFGMQVLMLGIVFFSYVYCRYLEDFETAQNVAFALGLVGGSCFLASTVFGYFGSNAMGASFLTLPASHLEKWLCGVLTCLVYVAVFLLFFYWMDMAFVASYHRSLDPNRPFYKELYESVQPFQFNGFAAKNMVVMFLNFAGAMLLGSLYFNKSSFIRVALLICGFGLGAYLLNLWVAKAMMNQVENALPYFVVWINVHDQTGRVDLPAYATDVISFLTWFGIPATLWLLAYVRLREKEF